MREVDGGASCGLLHVAARPCAEIRSHFHGRRVSWIPHRGPALGIVEVRIDGMLVVEVDPNSPGRVESVELFVSDLLPVAAHEISLTLTDRAHPRRDRRRRDVRRL